MLDQNAKLGVILLEGFKVGDGQEHLAKRDWRDLEVAG